MTRKSIDKEARQMAAFATKRHQEHTSPDDFCRKCRANVNARYLGIAEPYPVR